ncbi:hypothetical protein M501DRAFT_874111 [Patellaria atrata CBS 101060]|uniref:Uncharacterized protein n=1 Tax=Patellaria atrata CBS 101060 TaxID=1346257 RepID=A0A9P4VP36_9PEZI|nr:hypothetical protein M501DRAFT_874111 [Patellaria atrata CBS 101060]
MAADLFPQSFVFEMSEPMLDDEELERILTQHLHEKTSFNETDKALEEDSHVPSTTESSALIPYDGISTDPSCCPVTRTESLPDEVPAFNPSQGFENLVRRPSTAVPVMSTEPLFTELTLAGSTDDILLPITPTLFSYEYNPGSPLLGNIDRNLYSPPPPPPPPPFHDQFSRRRSRSEPPGEITFHRNGSYIGQKAASRQAFPLPAREPRGYRRQPYTASPRTPISKRPTKWNRKVETWMGPTSRPRSAAPSPCTVLGELASPFSTPLMSHREVNEVTPMENVMEAPPQQLMQERLASHKEASAVLGMYLERVTRDLDAVKHYLNKGFGFTEGPMGEVERYVTSSIIPQRYRCGCNYPYRSL